MTNLQSALVRSYSFYNLLTVPAQLDQFIVLEEINPFWNSGRIIREDDYDVIVSKTVKIIDLKTFYTVTWPANRNKPRLFQIIWTIWY